MHSTKNHDLKPTGTTGPVEIWRCSTGFGSSSARSKPFELSFSYVRLEAIIMLVCRGSPLFWRSSHHFLWVSEGAWCQIRGMLDLDSSITPIDNKYGLQKQSLNAMPSRYGQEGHFVLLRRLCLVSSYSAISGFSVLTGASHLLASLPFSHRPPHLEADSVGAGPMKYSI